MFTSGALPQNSNVPYFMMYSLEQYLYTNNCMPRLKAPQPDQDSLREAIQGTHNIRNLRGWNDNHNVLKMELIFFSFDEAPRFFSLFHCVSIAYFIFRYEYVFGMGSEEILGMIFSNADVITYLKVRFIQSIQRSYVEAKFIWSTSVQ